MQKNTLLTFRRSLLLVVLGLSVVQVGSVVELVKVQDPVTVTSGATGPAKAKRSST